MEPANARRLHIIKLCKQYRKDSVEPLDLNPQTLHHWLNEERYDTGKTDDDGKPVMSPLYPNEISAIVNYCYYRGDPRTIGAIMARK
jgi:hypothetical protein